MHTESLGPWRESLHQGQAFFSFTKLAWQGAGNLKSNLWRSSWLAPGSPGCPRHRTGVCWCLLPFNPQGMARVWSIKIKLKCIEIYWSTLHQMLSRATELRASKTLKDEGPAFAGLERFQGTRAHWFSRPLAHRDHTFLFWELWQGPSLSPRLTKFFQDTPQRSATWWHHQQVSCGILWLCEKS